MSTKINKNQESKNSLDKNKKSDAKLEAERKYGIDGVGELKIRDSKNDPVLFYLINAIDKDVRMEACREILKRALTDIYYGINETELVKQKDLVTYINERNVHGPTKQWLFTTGTEIKEPSLPIESKKNTIETEEEMVEETKIEIEEIDDSYDNDYDNNNDNYDDYEDDEDYEDDDDYEDEFEDNGL